PGVERSRPAAAVLLLRAALRTRAPGVVLGVGFAGDEVDGGEIGHAASLRLTTASKWRPRDRSASGGDPHLVVIDGEADRAVSVGAVDVRHSVVQCGEGGRRWVSV